MGFKRHQDQGPTSGAFYCEDLVMKKFLRLSSFPAESGRAVVYYHKIPKFSDARKHCCNLPKIQTKMLNLREFHQKGENGIANSEDPDQTAPLGAV